MDTSPPIDSDDEVDRDVVDTDDADAGWCWNRHSLLLTSSHDDRKWVGLKLRWRIPR